MTFPTKTTCWALTASVALASVGAVMSTSPTTIHRIWVAGGLAYLVLMNGLFWSFLPLGSRSTLNLRTNDPQPRLDPDRRLEK